MRVVVNGLQFFVSSDDNSVNKVLGVLDLTRLLTKGIFYENAQKTLLRIIKKMILGKFCQSLDIFKRGLARGFQRHQCKDCGKYFTLTPRGVPEKEKFTVLVLVGQWPLEEAHCTAF